MWVRASMRRLALTNVARVHGSRPFCTRMMSTGNANKTRQAVAMEMPALGRTGQEKWNTSAKLFGGVVAVALAGGVASLFVNDKYGAQAEKAQEMRDIRPHFEEFVLTLQDEICDAISELDGHKFREDRWSRPNNQGLGRSRVLQDGNVFEKAGVNVSIVKGRLPPAAVKQMRSRGKASKSGDEPKFYAAGISLVIHPKNPMAPTVHLNYRYFELVNPDTNETEWWFGGGADLTPAYLFEEDAVEFHKSLKDACDKHDPTYYGRFKKWCDEYFYNVHREECRGIGGIFFDDLDERPAKADATLDDREAIMAFSRECLKTFAPTYCKIVSRRKDMPFTEKQKEWQQIRRGRYVEFNLIYDRGTKFGLNAPKNSRIESILVSLPLTARWEYMHEPEPGSEEEKLVDILKKPREWIKPSNTLREASTKDIMAELARRSKLEKKE